MTSQLGRGRELSILVMVGVQRSSTCFTSVSVPPSQRRTRRLRSVQRGKGGGYRGRRSLRVGTPATVRPGEDGAQQVARVISNRGRGGQPDIRNHNCVGTRGGTSRKSCRSGEGLPHVSRNVSLKSTEPFAVKSSDGKKKGYTVEEGCSRVITSGRVERRGGKGVRMYATATARPSTEWCGAPESLSLVHDENETENRKSPTSCRSASEASRGEVEDEEEGETLSVAFRNDHLYLYSGSSRLRISPDGVVQLTRRNPALVHTRAFVGVAQAAVTLPEEADGVAMSWSTLGDGSCRIEWGAFASLTVRSVHGTKAEIEGRTSSSSSSSSSSSPSSWFDGLQSGFLVQYTNHVEDVSEATVDMQSSGHWYGGGHLMRQHWPLNKGCWEVGPFYPFDNGPNGVNTLLHPHWVTTHGLLVIANPDAPHLHVGMNAPYPDGATRKKSKRTRRRWGVGIQNMSRIILPMADTVHMQSLYGKADGMLRLQARKSYECEKMDHPLRDWKRKEEAEEEEVGGREERNRLQSKQQQQQEKKNTIDFVLSAHANVKDATSAVLNTLDTPAKPPNAEMIAAPIWTTWARYHENVNQAKVLNFAKDIVSKGLPRSVMEIDDKWQNRYGNLEFDSKKFPQPEKMVEELHEMGFKVTLWVMPFVEEQSDAYTEGSRLGYFIQQEEEEEEDSSSTFSKKGIFSSFSLKPGFFRWWHQQPVVALDVTNPDAVDWFVRRLRHMQTKYDIDGFKFDGGEPCFLPKRFKSFKPLSNPSEYTRMYVENVASKFEIAEVRTGHRTQSAPLLTRMGDRFSTWDLGNGLQSLIPTLLTSGILGYPFCLPDMVGGNAYFGTKPNSELMARWAQANAFMPAIQLSIAPWDVGVDTLEITRSALAMREKILETIVELSKEACSRLEPICRPLWWLDPHDEETFVIQDQFAIGNDVIVAPVVVPGQQRRDVYLTRGLWYDLDDPQKTLIQGGQWIRQFEAPLEKLPCFLRACV